MKSHRIFFLAAQKIISMTNDIVVGIPRGLLYSKYHRFAESFFRSLGLHIVVSPQTNKQILDEGVKCCVDDACLPVKVFHGHVSHLKNKCDYLLLPHFLSPEKGKTMCPLFCGLVEMIRHSINNLPPLIDAPIHSFDDKQLKKWALQAGSVFTSSKSRIETALNEALEFQRNAACTNTHENYDCRVALIGHSYIVDDRFINMNIISKLNALGVGVITSKSVNRQDMYKETKHLYKTPFWYFAQEHYGSAVSLYNRGLADGIIYLSAFCCGVDSVFCELIKHDIGAMPYMVLKLDEQTGEAALDTRIEAFTDMLKRRLHYGHHVSPYGQHLPGCQSVL